MSQETGPRPTFSVLGAPTFTLPDGVDLRPHGWAPGKYWSRECHGCHKPFWGDKRSFRCGWCALERHEASEWGQPPVDEASTRKQIMIRCLEVAEEKIGSFADVGFSFRWLPHDKGATVSVFDGRETVSMPVEVMRP